MQYKIRSVDNPFCDLYHYWHQDRIMYFSEKLRDIINYDYESGSNMHETNS